MAKATDLQKEWEDKISRAKNKREEWAKQFRVELARLYFEGKQNPGYPEEEWITINKIYSHLQSQLPSLYSMDPYFYVKLKKSFTPDPQAIAEYDQKGKTRQAYLNYLKAELDLKSKARLGIQDAYFAYGVAKTFFKADMVENVNAGEVIKGDDGEVLTGEDGGPLLEPDEIPTNERYVISRIDPDDFLWDEDAGPLPEKWSWIAERIRMTRKEAKNDRRLNKKALKSIEAKAQERDEKADTFGDRQPKKSEDEVLVFWEIYDLKNKQWLMIAEDGDAPLIRPRGLTPGVEQHPYSILRFTIRSKSPYPIPPVSQAIDPQKELCLARSRILTHRKRFNRKYALDETMFDDPDTAVSKMESGEDGTVLKGRGFGGMSPVHVIQDAPLDQQGYIELNHLNNDLNEVMGSGDEARGIASADSATQAGIIDKRLEVKEGDRLSIVVDWVTDIAKKLDQLVQTHITRDEAVKITGPQGEFWQLIKSSDYEAIDGEYEYSVNVGASSPRIPQIERAQWTAFMSQVIIPFPHVLTSPSFMKRMAEMFGIEDENMLEELRELGLKMMEGQLPMPGGQGSQAGVPESNPVAASGGQAGGFLGGLVNAPSAETI